MIDTTGKTIQQVSDEIAAKVIGQGGQSISSNGFCLYDDEKGRHCAVGWLMEKGSDAMKKLGGLSDLLERPTDIDFGVNDEFIRENKTVLCVLQSLHDSRYKRYRLDSIRCLKVDHEIDTTAWTPWVEMGKCEND